MMGSIVISAGIAYFLSLPFASVLQGGGYRLKALLRAKRPLFACLSYFVLSAGIEGVVFALLSGVVASILTFLLYVATGLFVFLTYEKMHISMHFTHRLVRLLVFSIFIYIAVFIGVFFVDLNGFWAVTPALSPFVLALSAAILSPFEKRNNARYIRRAKKKLQEHPATKLAVTGSYGKTSVKGYLEQLLHMRYGTLSSPENYNTPLGVAKTMEEATGEEQMLVLEMGARRRGDISELCELVRPDIGVITGIAPQHLETFGSIDNILAEKNVLAESVAASNPVFYNLTDPLVRGLYEKRQGKKIGVGYENADYLISDRVFDAKGSSFTLSKGDRSERITMPCVGAACVVNFSLAAAVALELGVLWEDVASAAKRAYPPAHRFEVVKSGAVTVIDDSYNVNPVGASVALESLRLFEGSRKIVYTSGMVELGEKEQEHNFSLGEKIADVASVAIVAEGRYGDAVARGIRSKKDIVLFRVQDTKAASALFGDILKSGDVLLIMSDLPRDYLL